LAVKVGYPDFYRLVVVERGVEDVRGVSPLGYRQAVFWYGFADGGVLSQERAHYRVKIGHAVPPPPATHVWYEWVTEEWFEAPVLLETALLGQVVCGFAVYAKVEAAGQCIVIEPELLLHHNDKLLLRLTGYPLVYTETAYTRKRSCAAGHLLEEVVLKEGDKVRARLGFKYMITVAGTRADVHFGKDAFDNESYLYLPIRILKPR